MIRQKELLRIIRLFAGLTAYSIGITLTVQANIGLAPWDVFHQGLALRTGMTFGTASIVVSAAIVALSISFKERLGIGTALNVFYIGAVIDVLMLGGFIKEAHSFLLGLAMMTCGLFVIAIAMVLYMATGYGAGPRDSLMVVLSKRTGKSAGLCRSVVEGAALFFGWLLGGKVGIGTVISVFGIGVAVQLVFSAAHFNPETIRHETAGETIARIKRGFNNKPGPAE